MKKLISLLLILTTLVGLTACGTPPPAQGPGDGDPPPAVPIENADLLAYSFNRIENADLSFNMTMGETASSTAKGTSSVSACASDNTVIIENPDELSWVDFFENEESSLETVRDQARRLCDFVLEKVTVVNKIVHESGMNYLLQYEGEDDVLTVYSFYGGVNGDALEKAEGDGDGGGGNKQEGYIDPNELALEGKVRNLARIRFSYDEDGDETVSWFSYDINYDSYIDGFTVNSMQVIYTPGKHYEIKSYTCQMDKTTLEKVAGTDFMNVTVADRSTGKWQGISWYGSCANALFSKEGEYDVNNNVIIGFVFETDDGLMQISGKLEAYRDGYMINSGEALETDDVRLVINQHVSDLFWLNIGNGCFTFSLSLENIDGWDRVVLDPSDEYDPHHCYLRGNDYVEFSNGKRLYGSDTNQTVWVDGVGLIHIRTINMGDSVELVYVDEDGEEHDYAWFDSVGGNDYSKKIHFGGETYLNPQTNTSSSFVLNADVTTYINNPMGNRPVCEAPFGIMKKFFVEMGLSSKLRPDLDKTFAAIESIYNNRTQYMDALFRDWNGVAFNYDTFVDYIFDSYELSREILKEYNGFATKHEAVDISMIPAMPESFALIAISDTLTGSVTVSESGLDFSAIAVAVEKNILLGDGNEYGVAAVLVGKGEWGLSDVFEVKAYENADMTLTGKSAVALPTALPEGEYTLTIYFGRKSDGGFARLSEVVAPAVSSFTAFEKRVDAAGGYYTYAYSLVDGALHITVSFTDTAAPAIFLTGTTTDSGRCVMTLPEGATVADLIANVTSYDDRDGAVIVTSDAVLLMDNPDGTAVGATDALISDAVYRITVADCSGNEASVSIKIQFE